MTTEPAVVPSLAPCPDWCTVAEPDEGRSDPHQQHRGQVSWNLVLYSDLGGPVMVDCEAGRLTLPEARRLARDLRKALRLAGAPA